MQRCSIPMRYTLTAVHLLQRLVSAWVPMTGLVMGLLMAFALDVTTASWYRSSLHSIGRSTPQ